MRVQVTFFSSLFLFFSPFELAELRSENKLLNRDLDKTSRMSAVLFEELSQQVVQMDRGVVLVKENISLPPVAFFSPKNIHCVRAPMTKNQAKTKKMIVMNL